MNRTIACSFIIFITISSAYADSSDREAYFGLSGLRANSGWEQNYGKELLATGAWGAQFFSGFKLNETFAIEIDYNYLKSKSNKKEISQNSTVLGRQIAIHEETHEGSYSLKGFGVGVSLFSDYIFEDVQLFAKIGVSNITPTVNHTHVSSISVIGMPETYINVNHKFTEKSKFIATAACGFHYLLSEEWAIRGSLNWLNTAKFKNVTKAGSGYLAKFKDTFLMNFGVSYLF